MILLSRQDSTKFFRENIRCSRGILYDSLPRPTYLTVEIAHLLTSAADPLLFPVRKIKPSVLRRACKAIGPEATKNVHERGKTFFIVHAMAECFRNSEVSRSEKEIRGDTINALRSPHVLDTIDRYLGLASFSGMQGGLENNFAIYLVLGFSSLIAPAACAAWVINLARKALDHTTYVHSTLSSHQPPSSGPQRSWDDITEIRAIRHAPVNPAPLLCEDVTSPHAGPSNLRSHSTLFPYYQDEIYTRESDRTEESSDGQSLSRAGLTRQPTKRRQSLTVNTSRVAASSRRKSVTTKGKQKQSVVGPTPMSPRLRVKSRQRRQSTSRIPSPIPPVSPKMDED